MPTKLKFKGDSTKKRRRREHDEDAGPSKRKAGDDAGDADTWVFPENAGEIRGPTFIFHPSDPSPICVTFDVTRGKVLLSSLDKHKEEEEEPDTSDAPKGILSKVPTDVSQVWVVTRVAGSPTVNLRTGTGDGKFLSCDTHGLVSAFREARGPQEEWTPVLLPDGMVAFMNVYEKYLGVDEVAGGAIQLRGDSEEVGFQERFWVKIQNKYKKEALEEERKKKDGMSQKQKLDEAETNKMFQTWGMGRSVISTDDKVELKKARKEGRLSEALLDRRSKLKSDRFC